MEDIGKQVKKSGCRKISHRKGRGCEKATWRMETLDTGRPSNQGPIVAPDSNYKVHIFDDPGLQKKRKKNYCPVLYTTGNGFRARKQVAASLSFAAVTKIWKIWGRYEFSRFQGKRKRGKGKKCSRPKASARDAQHQGIANDDRPLPKKREKITTGGGRLGYIAPAELGQHPGGGRSDDSKAHRQRPRQEGGTHKRPSLMDGGRRTGGGELSFFVDLAEGRECATLYAEPGRKACCH